MCIPSSGNRKGFKKSCQMPCPGRFCSYYPPSLPRRNPSPLPWAGQQLCSQQINQISSSWLLGTGSRSAVKAPVGIMLSQTCQGHMEKGLYWDIWLSWAPRRFSMRWAGVVFEKEVWIWGFGVNSTSLHSSRLKWGKPSCSNFFSWIRTWWRVEIPTLALLTPHPYPWWLPLIHHAVLAKPSHPTFSIQHSRNSIGIHLWNTSDLPRLGNSSLELPQRAYSKKAALKIGLLSWPLTCPGEKTKTLNRPATHPGFQEVSQQAMPTVLVSFYDVLIILSLDLFPEKKNTNLAFIQILLSHFRLCYNRIHHFCFSGRKWFFVTSNTHQ